MTHNQPPAITDAGTPFDHREADIILRSSDNVDFRMFKVLLGLASPVFRDMLAMPGSDGQMTKNDLPVVQVTEEQKTLERLLLLCYPGDIPALNVLADIQALLEAANKYNVKRGRKNAREWLTTPRILEADPVQVFAIACKYGWGEEAGAAAKFIEGREIVEKPFLDEMDFVTSRQLHALLQQYHRHQSPTATTITTPPNQTDIFFAGTLAGALAVISLLIVMGTLASQNSKIGTG